MDTQDARHTGVFIDDPVVKCCNGTAEQRRSCQPIPITLYESEPVYHQGKTIAVNKLYMVYGIRGGYLRVINKYTAKRGLLKGHSLELTDLAFQCNESNVFASINKDGSIIVWEVTESSPDASSVDYVQLVCFKPPEGESRYYRRLKWHPLRPDVLYTISDQGQVDVWSIQSIPRKSECLINDMLPADTHRTICPASSADIFDLGISYDGRILACGADVSHKVALWEVPDDCLGAYLPITEWAPHGDEPVNSLHFLGSASNPDLVPFLITGGPYNKELRLWSLQDVREGSIRLLQTITFAPNPTYQPAHWDEQPFQNVAQVDPTSQYLVVCNQKDPVAWTFHVKDPYLNEDQDLDTRLDYVTEFDVQTPVLSFGLTARVGLKAADPVDGEPAGPTKRSDAGIGMICIQTKTIQLWTLDAINPPEDPDALTAPDKRPENGAPLPLAANGDTPAESASSMADSELAAKERRRRELLEYTTATEGSGPTAGPASVPLHDPSEPAVGYPSALASYTPTKMGVAGVPPTYLPPRPTLSDVARDTAPVAPTAPSHPTAASPTRQDYTALFQHEPLPSADLDPPLPSTGDPTELLHYTLAKMRAMEQHHQRQWAAAESHMQQWQDHHRGHMEELRTHLQAHERRHEESVKEHRQSMATLQAQLQQAMAKQSQDTLRAVGDRVKESMEQSRAQLAAQVESRQKPFVDDVLAKVKAELAPLKEQIQASIKSQKEYNELARQKTKEAVDGEQTRMHKLLETVTHTIVNTVPDSFDQKLEAKLEAAIQGKVLPSLLTKMEAHFDAAAREGLKAGIQSLVVPLVEAAVQRVAEQAVGVVRTSLGEEVGRQIRPELFAPSLSRAITDQKPLLTKLMTEEMSGNLSRTLGIAMETELTQVLPALLHRFLSDALSNLGPGPAAHSAAAAAPPAPVSEEAVKAEASRRIQNGEFNQAFLPVLGLGSASVVDWLCAQTEPRAVFEGPHRLSNAVILSFIHQMAFTISSQTARKVAWLQECVIEFDPMDESTQGHVPSVLGATRDILQEFLADTPDLDPQPRKLLAGIVRMLNGTI